MTGRDTAGDGTLPPEQQAVRRLLADARATDPVPPAVLARLDRALADLDAERFGPAPEAVTEPAAPNRPNGPAPDDELAQRRRRQLRRRLVGAAAAVAVVAGLGGAVLGTDLVDSVTSATSSGDAASGAADAQAGGSASERRPLRRDGGRPEGLSDTDVQDVEPLDRSGSTDRVAGVARLGGRGLATQVEALLRARDDDLAAQSSGADAVERYAVRDRATCRAAVGEVRPDDRVLAVRYEGAPAELVVRDPAAGQSVVDLYVCGRPGIVRSVLVELP